uniref:hypothetical protein n=1 Tax=Chryseobacterium sp. POL2 TaxID=2713414 RepID=UPI0013E1E6B7|nr:hypothetical protein [Chryseobacterium sp. POL2]QIG88172.1 hypothetical protein G6R40_00200 [Chryseobacterium sp. POL2]
MSRKKRKNSKSSQKGKRSTKSSINSSDFKNNSSAPAPIKMKYFEASISDLENTVEERLESVREF